MRKVVWVATTDRTFREMAFEDIAAAESLTTKGALVGSFSGVWKWLVMKAQKYETTLLTPKEMSLQMFQVKVGLVAVRARIFAISRLVHRVESRASSSAITRDGDCRATRGTGKDPASSL